MKTVTIMKIPLQTECNRLKAIFKISQRIKTQWTLMTLGPTFAVKTKDGTENNRR